MPNQEPKPFEKPWFIVNCVAMCIGIYFMLFRHAPALFGLSMIAMAAHAIYSGHFALRNADYWRSEDPGQFWTGVIVYGAIGLFLCLVAML